MLVQGGAGAVGSCAVGLARVAGARVLATVRSGGDAAVAARAGAHEVVRTDGLSKEEVAGRLRALAPRGVDHIVEVAFSANIAVARGGKEQPFAPYIVKTAGGVKVAVIGITTPVVPIWEKPENLGSYRFLPAAEAVRAAATVAY